MQIAFDTAVDPGMSDSTGNQSTRLCATNCSNFMSPNLNGIPRNEFLGKI
jgi:hypothetical protein